MNHIVNGSIKNKKVRDKNGVFVFLLVLFSLFLFYPYEFYSVYWTFLPEKDYVITVSLFAVISFLFYILFNKYRIAVFNVILIQIFGFLIVGISHGKLLPVFDYSFRMLLAGLLVGLIASTIGLQSFYRKYNRWIALMAILGTITFFLVTFYGYNPISIVEDRADHRSIYNYLLTFSKSDIFSLVQFRYAGFFDEPGAMGFWGLFALLINRLFVKDKRLEIVLIVCLLFTFSMGFYFQLLFYVYFFMISTKNKHWSYFSIFFIVVLLFFAYKTKNTDNDIIYQSTFARIEETVDATDNYETLGGVGNRAEVQVKAYREFVKSPLFGTVESDSIYLGDNIYEPLARYGIIGTLLLYSPLIYIFYLSRRYKKREITKALIIILLGFFHRPIHMNVLSFFIMYSFLLFTIQQTRTKKEIAND